MKNMRFLFLTMLSASLLLMSCVKGDKGDTGATGQTGETGETGSANVVYSSWITLGMTYSSGDDMYEQTVSAPALTKPILDSGIVLTYIKVNNTGSIVNASGYMEEIFSVGSIALYSDYDLTSYQYRYVAIPGGVAGRGTTGIYSYTKEQLQKMSYDEVMKLIGQ